MQDDLSVLMEGIREYLPDQNTIPLEKAISQVQDMHSSCANFADNLSGSLNKFRVCNSLFKCNLAKFVKENTFFRMQSIQFYGITKSDLTGCSILTTLFVMRSNSLWIF